MTGFSAGQQSPPAARRVLGFGALLALGINGIVGVGIFFTPAELAALVPGVGSAFAFVATALLLLPVAWVYGRLGSAYPEDGGPYVWAREALGERLAFAVGFVAFASAVLSTAAVVSGLGRYLAPALGVTSAVGRLGFELALSLALCAVVLSGLRPSAWVWSGFTLLKLLPLVLLAGLGVWSLPGAASSAEQSASLSGLGRAALIAVFPLQGFEIVPVPAGEVRGGSGRVLWATLLSLLLAALLYVLLQLSCVLALPDLAHAPAPIVQAGERYTGGALSWLFAAGTNVSALGIAFGMFAMTPRYLSALGTRRLLGEALAREQRGVPRLALAITFACVVVFAASSNLSRLFVLSSLAVLTQYAVSALSLLLLSRRGVRGLGRIDSWLAPLSLMAIAALGQAAEWTELLVLAGVLGAGLLVQRLRLALARWRAPR